MNPDMRKIITSGFALLSITTALNAQQSINTVGTLSNVSTFLQVKIKDEDLKSKEVSKEVAVPKNGDIYINNYFRGIVIKTWDQQKVKVATTVYYEGESKLGDEEWFEKINLSLKTLGGSVKIKSGGISGAGNFYLLGSGSNEISLGSAGVTVFNGLGQKLGSKSDLKNILTITVPTGSKLDIESRYADVTLPDNINDLNVDITNGNLEAGNLNKFILRSKYSNINMGDIKTAEIEFINGRFSARNIDDLDIDSKNSTIEMAAAKKMVLRSINDEYDLEEAGDIRGRKNYGNFHITKLNGSLDIEGANADLKVRNVASTITFIKIDDKYADIRIPLKNAKNFSVDFTGAYSAVYGNFEKKAAIDYKGQLIAGTLSAPASLAITTLGSLGSISVSGSRITPNITHDTASRIMATTIPQTNITTAGSLSNLTVTGYVSPTYANGSNNLTALNIPGAVQGGTYTGVATSVNSNYYNRSFSSTIGNDTPSKFTAVVGDGKLLKIDVKCQNCTVDFK